MQNPSELRSKITVADKRTTCYDQEKSIKMIEAELVKHKEVTMTRQTTSRISRCDEWRQGMLWHVLLYISNFVEGLKA